MIQVDNPPTNMAFDMSLRVGNTTWPLGPVAWAADKTHWWAYDTDLPESVTAADVVLTPSALAAVRVRRMPWRYPPKLEEVWNGATIVLPGIKIRRQRISMCRIPPPDRQAAITVALEELDSADPVVHQLKLDGDLAEALARLRRTVDDAPHDVLTLYNLGCLELADGSFAAAAKTFTEAQRLDSPSPQQRKIQRQLRRICAICLYRAEKDDVTAMCTLGQAYERGWGVNQVYQEAKRWFRNAGNAGNAEAMRRLAAMYEKNLGATVHSEKAQQWYRVQTRQWYQKAADLGDREAMQWISTQDSR